MKTKHNHEENVIESILTRSASSLHIPSRDEFRPVFDRVTKNTSIRYTKQERISSRFFPNGFMIGSLIGVCLLIIAVVPTTYRNYQMIQSHYELLDQESDQEFSILSEEDIIQTEGVDKTLDQLIKIATL